MKHILIDYENIQPKHFDGIEINTCHVWLFLGINQQRSLPLELVETLLRFDSKKVHIIKMQHAGKNALDFYLSFYLGKISEIDPQANICIIARDSGYDVLVEHLNTVYDGLDIVRLADTNQLTLNDKSDTHDVIATAPNIEKTQGIAENDTNIPCDTANETATENQKVCPQSFEDNIPKSVIHDCYILVFDNIVNCKVFLPSYKSNVLYWMKKQVPVSRLETFNSVEQDYIFEQVFEKFVKVGFISFDGNSEKLKYKVDSQGILELVTEKVLLSKAKTVDGLNSVIKQKLANYRQENNDEQVTLILKWLKNQGYIKQESQTICYLGANNKTVHTTLQNAQNKSKRSTTIYQRAIALITSRPVRTRPSTKSSLANYLKSHLRNEDLKSIDNIIKQMINNKVITVSDTNKLTYKI